MFADVCGIQNTWLSSVKTETVLLVKVPTVIIEVLAVRASGLNCLKQHLQSLELMVSLYTL